MFAAHWEALNAAVAATASLPACQQNVLLRICAALALTTPPPAAQLDMAQLRLALEAYMQVGQVLKRLLLAPL